MTLTDFQSLWMGVLQLKSQAGWAVGASWVLAYLFGAMPFGYWLVKLKTGQDIRLHGSGSTGTTNVKRVAGKRMAFAVLALDLLKGMAAVWVAQMLVPHIQWVWAPYVHIGAAFLALVGHARSVFIGFTGGKAAATGLGTMVALVPGISAIFALVALGVFAITKTVSIASLTTAVVCPVLMGLIWAQGKIPLAYFIYGTLASAWVAVLHKENIQRLLSGTENKLT
ncbi:MAG: glycerol-3-phosphate 1-O-acyltransferase PlsY [Vampirovibrionales bacterium]